MMFPKPRPAIFSKRDARLDKERTRRHVYALVTVRDQRRCRCCGRRESLHHHHLTYRSKGGEDTSSNVVLLCAFCHALEHVARQLVIIGDDADRLLRFEIHEAAVSYIFGTKTLPRHVRIVTGSRRSA